MTLPSGTRLGPYEVTTPLGAGGMGEVYRARDTKLDRDVALKILPESFASDPDRLMRFEREAKTLAALNHPNIAQIYGIEDASGARALVMELVEGEGLSQRIGRGAIPVADAVPIARQIAEALEAAHDAGIIHRDLKPANVKVRGDGTVKVLDFGLAKAADASSVSGAGPATNSPTMTSPALTAMGVILGTAAYMAPEQAKGRPVDRRADIWAFGVVLYEMLTGRRAFEGDDVSDLLVAVLSKDVDVSALPPATPPRLKRLIERCLDRNPKTRLQHIGEARVALADPGAPDDRPAATPSAGRARSSRLIWGVAAGCLLVGGALGLGLASRLRGSSDAPASLPARALVLAAEGRALSDGQSISPDGRFVAYVASGALWIRNLGELDARKVPNSEGAARPFWSPRNDAVAFAANARLYKVAIDGSQPVELCRLEGGTFSGGAWSAAKGIVFTLSRANWSGDVRRVPENGGEPERFAVVDAGRGERRLYDPHFLPDGQTLVYAMTTVANDQGELAVDRGGFRTPLNIIGRAPAYAPGSGLLFFTRLAKGTRELWAVRLPLQTLVPDGEPFFVARDADGASASTDGTIVYAQTHPDPLQLVWVDRTGAVQGTASESIQSVSNRLILPAASDDGALVVVQGYDIFVWDVERGVVGRAIASQDALYPGRDLLRALHAAWLPGSRDIVYTTNAAVPQILARRFDGTGEERVIVAAGGLGPDVSAEGTSMAFYRIDPKTQRDVWGVMLDKGRASGEPFPVAHSIANEAMPQISPDGKWVAYQSDESGRWEVWVQPFPRGEGRLQVSLAGGESPVWNRRGGGELFYTSGNDLMAVDITTSPTLAAGTPRRLFSGESVPTMLTDPPNIERVYAPGPDGRRFVVVKGTGMGRSEVILRQGPVGPTANSGGAER